MKALKLGTLFLALTQFSVAAVAADSDCTVSIMQNEFKANVQQQYSKFAQERGFQTWGLSEISDYDPSTETDSVSEQPEFLTNMTLVDGTVIRLDLGFYEMVLSTNVTTQYDNEGNVSGRTCNLIGANSSNNCGGQIYLHAVNVKTGYQLSDTPSGLVNGCAPLATKALALSQN